MGDLQSMRKAAATAGVDRKTVENWVKLGLLKGKPAIIGRINATLVSVKALRALAKTRPVGRPRKVPA
ncbi:MAG TPA: hypothetical protein VK797_31170 [Tepidisphaeraceae bacterium]|jgi:hypothetical protein|nr:hypothetical protein [Tepidisphaeraceae bacterium]